MGNAAMAKTGARSLTLVVAASSAGTVLEWYDFYLYGSLAVAITRNFLSGVDEASGFILALLVFSAGFAVRPLGSLVFGRLGDKVGRKNTFLVTLLLMGVATFCVGLLPTFKQIGVASPLLLVTLRMVQGLALGGEYGGAATYVAEHAPLGRRGYYTSWIQATATAGLVMSLGSVLLVRGVLGEAAFQAWGWRLPFLLSALLLMVSLWMRLKLHESPVFQQMLAEGTTSRAPIKESLTRWPNLRLMLLALFGLVAGQGVVSYVGQIYVLFFVQRTLRVEEVLSNQLVAVALICSAPFYVLFGWLADRIGPRKIIFAGLVTASAGYLLLFHGLTSALNPALAQAMRTAPATVLADPKTCSFQFDPVGKAAFTSPCDVATAALAKAGAPYTVVAGATPGEAVVAVGVSRLTFAAGSAKPTFEKALGAALTAAGYPASADRARMNMPLALALLAAIEILVATVYGPIAVALVNMFPARVRYTSMSLPYHLGNGWFGGFLPPMAFALVTATGNIYAGLAYPLGVMAMTLVVGVLFLRGRTNIDPEATD